MEKAIDFCFRTEGAAGSVAPTIDSNGCTYDLAERYRLMQSICRTRKAYSEADRSRTVFEKRKLIKEKEPKRKLTKKRDWDNII